MAYFVRVKDSSGYDNLINIELITRIRPRNDGGALIELASEHQQNIIVNREDYRKILEKIEIAE